MAEQTSAELEDAVAQAEEELAARDDDDAVFDTVEEPVPLGRSWQFDFSTGRFVRSRSGAIAQTRGLDTLRSWILKALHTPRGASPALPDSFGIDGGGLNSLLGGSTDEDVAQIAELITDALTTHPRIAAVRDFTVALDDEAAAISFRVVLDNDEELLVEEAL